MRLDIVLLLIVSRHRPNATPLPWKMLPLYCTRWFCIFWSLATNSSAFVHSNSPAIRTIGNWKWTTKIVRRTKNLKYRAAFLKGVRMYILKSRPSRIISTCKYTHEQKQNKKNENIFHLKK